MEQISYAINMLNNEIVHISEIPKELNGKKCGCICPFCKQPLIAKGQGKKREHHFAHLSEVDAIHIQGAKESVLHILGKQIIQEEMKVFIPDILLKNPKSYFYDNQNYGQLDNFDKKELIKLSKINSTIIDLKTIELEKRIGDIIPDVFCTYYDDVLDFVSNISIEILVTHKCDYDKIEKYRQLDTKCIEIDLSSLLNFECDIKTKIKELILSGEKTKWIYINKDIFNHNVFKFISRVNNFVDKFKSGFDYYDGYSYYSLPKDKKKYIVNNSVLNIVDLDFLNIDVIRNINSAIDGKYEDLSFDNKRYVSSQVNGKFIRYTTYLKDNNIKIANTEDALSCIIELCEMCIIEERIFRSEYMNDNTDIYLWIINKKDEKHLIEFVNKLVNNFNNKNKKASI